MAGKWRRIIVAATAQTMVAGAVVVGVASAQTVTQTAGVDDTWMGAYRALAQLSYDAFQKGDKPTAAKLARILERTWDAAEGGRGYRSLVVKNKNLFEAIDQSMDAFIMPIVHYKTRAPEPATIEAAYTRYLEMLKKGDE